MTSSDMDKELRVLELFSGIGGMHHALDLVRDVEVKADDSCGHMLKQIGGY